MSNPFNTLNPNNPMNANSMASYRNAYQMLRNSNNPMALFQQMAKNNPQLQPIANMLMQGGNPQQIFYSMCKQRGIDPQAFISQITR